MLFLKGGLEGGQLCWSVAKRPRRTAAPGTGIPVFALAKMSQSYRKSATLQILLLTRNYQMKYGIIGLLVLILVVTLGMFGVNIVGQNQIQNIGKSAIENAKRK